MTMEFQEWAPVYSAICADFGFDRSADEHARDVLASLVSPFDREKLAAVAGASVAIAGGGPSLPEPANLEAARNADIVFAASTAADVLASHDIRVDCMVTDLDKNPETVRQLTAAGVPVAVHAHGDNIPAVRAVVPDCADSFVLPTTQARPRGPVENFGGFTDGDRAAFLADAFGASSLRFVGWDFDDPTVDSQKNQKLVWAERLLYWLEYRRGERFSVLDGRRQSIETEALPLE